MDLDAFDDLTDLPVLAAYDFHKMEQLVRDFTNALDESKHTGRTTQMAFKHAAGKKRRCKKRKSAVSAEQSEASESSVDEVTASLPGVSGGDDSDVAATGQRRLRSLAAFASTALTLAESDSLNETISPLRRAAQHRRRKLKRMAVDATAATERPNSKVVVGRGDHADDHLMDTEGFVAPPVWLDGTPPDALSGKRKRAMRDKGGNSVDLDMDRDDQSKPTLLPVTRMEFDTAGVEQWESSSSSFSSSTESEDVTNDNDADRDGDDEQSDFFHEAGPACGIPGIVPWWETEKLATADEADEMEKDASFEKILNGALDYMSSAAQRSLRLRLKLLAAPGRKIRAGQRHLQERNPVYSLKHFLEEQQQWTTTAGNKLFGGPRPDGDNKRRRQTPPASPINDVEIIGGAAEPIPKSNIGNQLLRSMGWKPGIGLGAEGTGIQTPIMAEKRPRRKGLGMTSPS